MILDLVPNHTSHEHRWFQAALRAGPGAPERDRYWFRPGRGPDGSLPPNDWRSQFGGTAWTRIEEPDGSPGEWYLHLFAPEQPDLNWNHPEVRTEFEDILRFWFDRGVDGFRIDVAHSLAKDPTLPDVGDEDIPLREAGSHPAWDRDEVHEIYRHWRRIAETYEGNRTFVAEAWVGSPERLARYLRHDGLHTAFNFDFLISEWDAKRLREVIDCTLAAHEAVRAPATWVLSNHDVTRTVTRLGRAETGLARHDRTRLFGTATDLELGRRRARAAALLMFALPGGAYVYQGEELGLWEVEDLPDEVLQDPTWQRTAGRVRGRDGCRVPLPWSGDEPPFGFSRPDVSAPSWLPQPASWADLTVAAQDDDPASMLALYRTALRIRREHPALGDGQLIWVRDDDEILWFARDDSFQCVVNLSDEPLPLPFAAEIVLASESGTTTELAPDAAVWLDARREDVSSTR